MIFLEFFQAFSWILNNFCLINIFIKLSTDIFDISVFTDILYLVYNNPSRI